MSHAWDAPFLSTVLNIVLDASGLGGMLAAPQEHNMVGSQTHSEFCDALQHACERETDDSDEALVETRGRSGVFVKNI